MQSQSQLQYHESYFILPVKKQPTMVVLPSPLLMTGVLTLFAMLIMVTIALSLGLWWDGLWSAR